MGTKQTTTTGLDNVMSDFAVSVFGVMLAVMTIGTVGGIVYFVVAVTRHYMGL